MSSTSRSGMEGRWQEGSGPRAAWLIPPPELALFSAKEGSRGHLPTGQGKGAQGQAVVGVHPAVSLVAVASWSPGLARSSPDILEVTRTSVLLFQGRTGPFPRLRPSPSPCAPDTSSQPVAPPHLLCGFTVGPVSLWFPAVAPEPRALLDPWYIPSPSWVVP